MHAVGYQVPGFEAGTGGVGFLALGLRSHHAVIVTPIVLIRALIVRVLIKILCFRYVFPIDQVLFLEQYFDPQIGCLRQLLVLLLVLLGDFDHPHDFLQRNTGFGLRGPFLD